MICQEINEGSITTPAGFTAGAVYVGVKSHKSYKPDVAILYSEVPDTRCAALFTTNRFCAAPVILGRTIAASGRARGVVVNSGNANAGTGEDGIRAAQAVERCAETLLGLPADSLFVSSTGVIGEPLPVEKVKEAVRRIVPALSGDGGHAAAWAIMTTDRMRKEYACRLKLSGGWVHVGVMAKGSGMIHPNLATTLCFLTTDAVLEPSDMHVMLKAACEDSFHMLTVDGDTSTNDSLIMFANGASGIGLDGPEDRAVFAELLEKILQDMAQRIAMDGEGAGHMMRVTVKGLASRQEAREMARTVARANSVKAALGHGTLSEALVLSAAGSAESTADFMKAACHLHLNDKTAEIEITFRDGTETATAFGCDLTEEYVHLNGDYRS